MCLLAFLIIILPASKYFVNEEILKVEFERLTWQHLCSGLPTHRKRQPDQQKRPAQAWLCRSRARQSTAQFFLHSSAYNNKHARY